MVLPFSDGIFERMQQTAIVLGAAGLTGRLRNCRPPVEAATIASAMIRLNHETPALKIVRSARIQESESR